MLWIGYRLIDASNVLTDVGVWFVDRAHDRLERGQKLAGEGE